MANNYFVTALINFRKSVLFDSQDRLPQITTIIVMVVAMFTTSKVKFHFVRSASSLYVSDFLSRLEHYDWDLLFRDVEYKLCVG